jgi:hypothetical protein
MVANTIHRTRQYSPGDLQRMEEPECDDSDDSVDRQKVSVAPDSDKVTIPLYEYHFLFLAHSAVIQIPQYVEVEPW